MADETILKIIKPELDKFAKETGFKYERGNFITLKRFCRLFCHKYRNMVWVYGGKLYKVAYKQTDEYDDFLNFINVYEISTEKDLILNDGRSNKFPSNVLLIGIVILWVYTNIYHARDTVNYLFPFVILLHFMWDTLEIFYYKVRFIIGK